MKHLVSIEQLTRKDIEQLLERAAALSTMKREEQCNLLRGRVVISMFYEPSTRTRLSFESAALKLGAGVTGFSESKNTSASKGETLEDSVRMCGSYGDALVLRHSESGSAARAAAVSSVPVVNAGDGANEHPTQTLVDLYTLWREHGRLDELQIAFVGDLRFGRTVHSLIKALALFKGTRVILVAPPALGMPDQLQEAAQARGVSVAHASNVRTVLGQVDSIYMTRVQRERIPYDMLDGISWSSYRLTKELVSQAPDHLRILHPLPRVDELTADVDSCVQAAYFRQAAAGIPVRQSLLLDLLAG